MLLDLFPVCLVVPLNWLDPELPWSVQPCVLLHAVVMSSVVDLDDIKVCLGAVLLQCRHSLGLLEIYERLDVHGTFGTSL
jgi:hypothetical protein